MDQKPTQAGGYSTLEVDESANLPQVKSNEDLPQVKSGDNLPEVTPNHDYPEVVQNNYGAGDARVPEQRKPQTVCGLRKRTFWLVLFAVILAIVIGIAVGVGVGVSTNKKHSSSNSSGDSSGTTTATDTSGRVAFFSQLSATNYTDPQEKEHSQVYFQDGSLDIWMADREASDGSAWSLSQVNTTGTSPKNGTPIAAFNYFPEASVTENNEVESEFGLRYLDTGTNQIRARFVKNRMIGQTWQVAPTPDQSNYRAASNSSLAGYADACAGAACVQTNMLAFADADDARTHVAYPYAARYGYDTFPSSRVGADAGTAYAFVPVLPLARVNDSQPYVAMYLSARGRLREVYFGVEPAPAWNASDMDVDLVVDTGGRIAAMARRLDDLRYVQVLATKRDGGVMMAYLDGGPDRPWAATETVQGMENVIPLSPIAANQVGHVYALEELDGRPEIVEWKMTSETGTPTFDRVGVFMDARVQHGERAVELRKYDAAL
ncbi:hypothetical protein SLS58_005160 [Diplodia intermedia]|uniref:Fungal fucose-specific lectin n=1 Tax=Diplodia intermedia TaxID=856260 RepID=A0ABR3TRN2_9PEZI